MIKIENVEVAGWEHAIRGMRNPKNSWRRSDSTFKETAETQELVATGEIENIFVKYDALSIGPNDHQLMMNLANGGPVHAKYRRMIVVWVDITAPLYWWKEFDTYKVGTVANSCSTMHKLDERDLTLDDFSHEHLITDRPVPCKTFSPIQALAVQIDILNTYRKMYIASDKQDKEYWLQMIQLLPSSYNQKRTIMLNYEVLVGMYKWRKNHKLDEWRELCEWIESLPYSEIITGEKDEE